MSIILGILWFVCSAAVYYLYHTLFNVIYFDFANGCLKELIACGLIGAILAGLIFYFWYISIPLALLVIFAVIKKKRQ